MNKEDLNKYPIISMNENEIIVAKDISSCELNDLREYLKKNNSNIRIKKLMDITDISLDDYKRAKLSIKFCSELIDEITAIGITKEESLRIMQMIREYLENAGRI